LIPLSAKKDTSVVAFVRQKGDDKVLVILNLSGDNQDFVLNANQFAGDYLDIFSNGKVNLPSTSTIQLVPWSYLVYAGIED